MELSFQTEKFVSTIKELVVKSLGVLIFCNIKIFLNDKNLIEIKRKKREKKLEKGTYKAVVVMLILK